MEVTLQNTQDASKSIPDMKLVDFVRLLLEEDAEKDPVIKLGLDIIKNGVHPYSHGRKMGSAYAKNKTRIIYESIQS